MKTLYVIDASGYLYRSYFAIRNMTNDQGESTNALFGFARSLLKIFKDFNPDHAVAVFDGKDNCRLRKEVYPSYKANRSSMPPDMLYQIEWGRELCRLLGLQILSIEGVEADDTIGAVAKWASGEGSDVAICSTDKDLCQLVNDHIYLIDTYKENLKIDSEQVEEKFGVPPSLIIDYLSLTGDSSDNIPGVPGIGPKSAADLLLQFGSLDQLLAHPEQIAGKKKQELIAHHKQDALLSRELVKLNLNVDFPHEAAFFVLNPMEKEPLKAFYSRMRFNSLLKELDAAANPPGEEKATPEGYRLINSAASLTALIEHLSTQEEICVDTETTGLSPLQVELVGIGLGFKPEEAWYIPFNGEIQKEDLLKTLKPFFANPKIGFYGQNIKYDAHVLKRAGLALHTISFDTLLASYLLNAHSRNHSLDELSLQYFGFVKTSTSSLIGKGKTAITMKEVPIEKVSAYCCEDVDYTIRLKKHLAAEIENRHMQKLYYELELPLLKVLFDMEEEGIYLDTKELALFGKDLAKELEAASKDIFQLAGEEFNLNSPMQIGKILFEKLGIPPPKGTSTSAEVLDELKWTHPIAGKIQEYRGLEKLRSTYVDTLPLEVNKETGRIHCTFNQSVTATGRLSCQDPNLQNIPVRSKEGLRIREAFKPQKPDWSYVSADYSQIELRLLAHFSQDPILISAFCHEGDIHLHTASLLFHEPLEKVTKEMRSKAKAVNFGIIYGQGPYGLSQAIGISQKEAAEFIRHYFEQYPKVKAFLESCKDSARLTGKAVTLLGRERAIPEILSKNVQIRNAAERFAVNTPFQGSQADLIKMAMLALQRAIQEASLKGFLILQIHDELICEVPDAEVEIFKKIMKEKMEGVMKLNVPLTVDVGVGKNWKEC